MGCGGGHLEQLVELREQRDNQSGQSVLRGKGPGDTEGTGELTHSQALTVKKEPLQSWRRDSSFLETRKPPKVAELRLKDKFTLQGHRSEFPLFQETFCSHLHSDTIYI